MGQQVRYRLMMISGDHRFYRKVGRLLAAKRTTGVVDFGEPLGRWRVRFEELEPYPDAAPGFPGPGTSATASPAPLRRKMCPCAPEPSPSGREAGDCDR